MKAAPLTWLDLSTLLGVAALLVAIPSATGPRDSTEIGSVGVTVPSEPQSAFAEFQRKADEGPPACVVPERSGRIARADRGDRSNRNGRTNRGRNRNRAGSFFGPGSIPGMPEAFRKMAESFASNPAGGFPQMMQNLAELEDPALDEITLTAEEERRLGRQALKQYLDRARAQGHETVEDRRRLRYLDDLVATIHPLMKHGERYSKIEVTLLEAPLADAHAFPGGFLVFTTPLFDEPDEAAILGVVAHELAHLDRGHLYGYAKRSKLFESTYQQGPMGSGGFDTFMTRQMALFGLMMNPYRPEHESEADCVSATWMYLRGYDPRALADFLDRMHARIKDRPENPNGFEFGRSHPYSLARRDAVNARYEQLMTWRRRDDLGRYPENLRRLNARIRQNRNR